ncbi:hypothetical protein QCA50_007458 [Cerrena zonata]|uniref:F-box domain-containing protein n=1 Tax=Cerrena zonata TaxID=2478898 RepID=A0AAW0G7P0_9APHY
MLILPVEVWENVIDLLVEGYTTHARSYSDGVSLRNDLIHCALVCHAWLPRAQMHLCVYIYVVGSGLSTYEKLINRMPKLCISAKELQFQNIYTGDANGTVADRTVETISHVVRIAHKLPHVHTLFVDDINLSIEHPYLPKYVTALTSIKALKFYTRTPTRLVQLAHFIAGFKNISELVLEVPIVLESNPLSLKPCYTTKSTLTRLYLLMQPGGYLLLDWLVKAHSFTTSLHILQVRFLDAISQSELALTMQSLQYMLNNCASHLKEWIFWAKIKVNDFKGIPSVSLATHSAITGLNFRVSSLWFKHALQQLKTITSKNITVIHFWYWLDETEKPALELWAELDDILDADHFSLTKVDVACVYQDVNFVWKGIGDFNRAEEFPKLLPKVYKRGLLTW